MAWAIISSDWNRTGPGNRSLGLLESASADESKFLIDKESGERLGTQTAVAQRSNRYNQSNVNSGHYNLFSLHCQGLSARNAKNYFFCRPFRVSEALRLAEVYNRCQYGPTNFGKKKERLQNNTNIDPRHYSSFATQDGSCNSHISTEHINNENKSEHRRESENVTTKSDIIINIWEEFRYGSAILNKKIQLKPEMSHGGCEWARPIVASLLPEYLVDSILCVLFFAIYFVFCCLYNSYLYLAWCMLYDLHLRIHENADKHNLRVRFKGTAFQGPMYCFIRLLCHHCAHDEMDELILKLMVKMKRDITKTK